MKLPKLFVFIFAACAVVFSAGCVAVAAAGAAAGTVAYVRGDLRAVVEGDVARVARAVNRARGDLGFVEISAANDTTSGKFVWRTADDRKIEVRLRMVTEQTTEVSVRVGVFGDEALSRMVYDKIRDRL